MWKYISQKTQSKLSFVSRKLFEVHFELHLTEKNNEEYQVFNIKWEIEGILSFIFIYFFCFLFCFVFCKQKINLYTRMSLKSQKL